MRLVQTMPAEMQESEDVGIGLDSVRTLEREAAIGLKTHLPGAQRNGEVAASKKNVRFGSNGVDVYAMPYHEFGMRYTAVLHGPSASHHLRFDLSLPEEINVLPGAGGSALLADNGQSDFEAPLGVWLPPVAYDAAGERITVSQQISTSAIELDVPKLDASAYPLYVDPTYVAISCSSSRTTYTAAQYFGDNGYCPYGLTFWKANGYWPVKSEIQGAGYRKIRETGECSYLIDTAASYDFQVPCKMHDFGYDLIRVKNPYNYPYVTKPDVDGEFLEAMQQHCASRSILLQPSCYETAYFAFVGVQAADPKQERPSSWGSNEYLTNRSFNSGTSGWTFINGPGGTMSYTVYDRSGFTEDFVEFHCNTAAQCRIQQNADLSPDAFGGEEFIASGTFRCKVGTCPVRYKILAKRHSDGVLETVATDSWNLSNPNQLQWSILQLSFTLPQKRYTQLQYLFYNDSTDKNVDIFTPTLTVQPDRYS